jgi:hypothetical protein
MAVSIGEDRCWLYTGPGEIANKAELDVRAIHRTGARVEDLYNERLIEEGSGLSVLAVAGDDEEGCRVSRAWKGEIPSGTPENKNKGDKSDTHPETSPDRLLQAPIHILKIGRVTPTRCGLGHPLTDEVADLIRGGQANWVICSMPTRVPIRPDAVSIADGPEGRKYRV